MGQSRDEIAPQSQPAPEDIRTQLAHMMESASFRASPRRRAMLQFIIDETLSGRSNRLKGVTLAQNVFGRDETFDQQSDPVVRLEARRLRSDLDSYYVDAGADDPIRVTIPKGSYVPHFAWQNQDTSTWSGDPNSRNAPPSLVDRTAPPSAAKKGKIARPVPRALTATVVAVVGLLAIGAAVFIMRSPEPEAAMTRTPAIIVLPFEAFGDNEDIGLIASSVTEELIANLMLFQDFRVYSMAASFHQAANRDPEKLRQDLGVSYVVTGLMQSENKTVTLRARLVDAATGEVLWSGSYDEPLTPGDLLHAQHDLAVAISTELGEPYGAVNEAIGQRMVADGAPSMPSYACILRAYEYRRAFEDALFWPAMACLEEAVVRDPAYSDAWAMLGWLHLDAVRQDIVPEIERPARMAAAFDAASHAVDLAPGSPRALAALSVVTFYRGDYDTSADLQREVLALNPHDPDALAQLGWRLAVRGNPEGLDYLHQAIARSANPPGWYSHLIAVYAYMDGDYERALAATEKSAADGSPMGMSFAAMTHAKLGDMNAAHEALVAMVRAWPLLGHDPAAAYRMHHASDEIVDALVEGLRAAGWTEPRQPLQ